MPDKERFRSQTQKATLSHEEVVKAAQSYKPLASTAAERAAVRQASQPAGAGVCAVLRTAQSCAGRQVKAARNKSSVNFTHDHQPTVKHRMKSHNQQRSARTWSLALPWSLNLIPITAWLACDLSPVRCVRRQPLEGQR